MDISNAPNNYVCGYWILDNLFKGNDYNLIINQIIFQSFKNPFKNRTEH